MKVLQINSVCGYGSTGRIATDLYDMLTEEGHECCIAYGRGKAPAKYKTIKIGNKLDFFSHVLKTRLFDLHGLGSKIATKRFIKEIEKYNPDVIHLHNIHGYYINFEVLFNYLSTLSIPIVWLLHDAWSISGHSAHFKLDKNGNIPTKNEKKNQHREYPTSYFYDNSRKNFLLKQKKFTAITNMTIVTPSYWLANLVEKSFLNKYEIVTIHNGTDLSKFKPIKSDFRQINGLQDKKIILGVASIWSEKKGLHIFNELAGKLDDNYKIILVGITDKQKRKLNPSIISISRTESIDELAMLYSAADLFVNPTTEDNFPTTNIEALACGTPVITFDTGGCSEAIDEKTGVVIKGNNTEGLINIIVEKVKFPFSNNNCRQQAINFDKDKKYKEYIDLYERVLNI